MYYSSYFEKNKLDRLSFLRIPKLKVINFVFTLIIAVKALMNKSYQHMDHKELHLHHPVQHGISYHFVMDFI